MLYWTETKLNVVMSFQIKDKQDQGISWLLHCPKVFVIFVKQFLKTNKY